MASRIRPGKPRGRPMGKHAAKDNGHESAVRAKVEHVFAHRNSRMALKVCTISIAHAKAAITFANMTYNMNRLCWLRR